MIHRSVRLRFFVVWLFVILALELAGVGCRRVDPVDSVGLLGVDSPAVGSDEPLELRAEGLPTGRRVQVRLQGRLAAAGQDERELDVSLVGQVLAPERLSISIDPALMARWGRATFDGSVVVDCDPPAPRGCHGALQQAHFDVEVAGVRAAQQLHHAVDRLLPALGLTISDADSATYGLLVADVRAGSLAARAGLREGDTIFRSNGLSLHALADLAPGPSAEVLSLGVRRVSGQTLTLRLPLADAPPLSDPRLLGICLVASPLLLLLLARMGMPTPAALVEGLIARSRLLRRRVSWPFAAGALLSLLLGTYSALNARAFDPFVLLLLQLGGIVLLRGARVGSDRRIVLDELGLWAAVLSVAAVSGTRAWHLLLREQSGLPWAWNALARLPLSAACVLFVLSAARMHSSSSAAGSLARLWMHVLRALLAPLCAGLFFGGAFVPPGASFGVALFAGSVAAFKSFACYALVCLLEGVSPAASRNMLWVLILAVTPIWARLVPGRPFELIWGSVACVMCGCIALAGLVSVRRNASSVAAPQPTAAPKKPRPAPRARPASAAAQPETKAKTQRAPRPVPQTQA